jgi:hypothetical protein
VTKTPVTFLLALESRIDASTWIHELIDGSSNRTCVVGLDILCMHGNLAEEVVIMYK